MTASLPPLLPEPRRAEARPGHFALSARVPLVLSAESDPSDFRTARLLAELLARRSGVRLPVETHARRHDLGPRVELVRRGEAGEGYRLDVEPGGVRLVGDGPAGLRYAALTAAQLVDARGRLPACQIEDAPDLAMRGIMLDISRGKVPTQACLREWVDRCAALKLNTLMLYTEHTFRFRRHPEIGADASPLEAETLRALDAYAAERHVELVPTLQMLGHMGQVLKLPRYAGLAESELGWSLSPADPGTYALLDDLLDEYLPNFRSGWLNANCDEPWDLGRGRSKAREAEIGPGGVYAEHVAWVNAAARARGRRTMIWADGVHQHPESVATLPRDLLLLDWWYEAKCDYDRVKRFSEHGLEFAVCPGTSSWNCLFPRVENSLRNIQGWAGAARRHGARGLICTDWGDFGHYNLLGGSWLAYAWAAQQAWSGDTPPARFDRAFGRALFGETRGEAARCYRALGAAHDAGFQSFNGSPLQWLFFDDLDRAFFLRQARPGALRRTAGRLERAQDRLEAARNAFAGDLQTFRELDYAARASRFAVEKSQAALAYLAWCEAPKTLRSPGRRALARQLRSLATRQRGLGRELRRLWDARSRPSNFEITRSRLEASVQSLGRAARALERGAPPPEPAGAAETTLGDIHRELRDLAEGRAPLPRPLRRAGGAAPRRTRRPRARKRPGS